jgi:hypothetical protein
VFLLHCQQPGNTFLHVGEPGDFSLRVASGLPRRCGIETTSGRDMPRSEVWLIGLKLFKAVPRA